MALICSRKRPFLFPLIGEGNMVKCYRLLLQYLKGKGFHSKIARVPEEAFSQIDWKTENFMVEFNRDQCNYIYLTKDLIKLQGIKYHRKRNHIKRFEGKYSYQYIPLTSKWI